MGRVKCKCGSATRLVPFGLPQRCILAHEPFRLARGMEATQATGAAYCMHALLHSVRDAPTR